MMNRIATKPGRKFNESPIGFTRFADSLCSGSPGFGEEKFADVTFMRADGTLGATDKGGIIAAEISAQFAAPVSRAPQANYGCPIARTPHPEKPADNLNDAQAVSPQWLGMQSPADSMEHA